MWAVKEGEPRGGGSLLERETANRISYTGIVSSFTSLEFRLFHRYDGTVMQICIAFALTVVECL